LPHGCGTRIVRRHSGLELFLLAERQMEAHFLLQVRVELAAMDEHVDTPCEFAQPIHSAPPSRGSIPYTASITRVIAPMTRSNCAISTANCLRPAGVNW
jgi:hypothetical protein